MTFTKQTITEKEEKVSSSLPAAHILPYSPPLRVCMSMCSPPSRCCFKFPIIFRFASRTMDGTRVTKRWCFYELQRRLVSRTFVFVAVQLHDSHSYICQSRREPHSLLLSSVSLDIGYHTRSAECKRLYQTILYNVTA